MIQTKLPRKIIGMNRKPKPNCDYTAETFNGFLHGFKNARKTTAKKDLFDLEMEWPASPRKDSQLIWPSQVFLSPSLAVETGPLKKNFQQETTRYCFCKDNNFAQRDDIISTTILDMSCTMDELNQVFAKRSVSPYIETPIVCEKFSSAHDAFKALCLKCATDGEKIAKAYCNRPFFKKIDGLCDRVKQELIHHDSAVPHLNQQGIVWAIKDFVFVCNRIINAWNIIKEYIYDPSEGLNKIRSALSHEFVPSFVVWQEANLKLIENLMMSFLSFDIVVHTQDNQSMRYEFFKKLYVFMHHVTKSKKLRESSYPLVGEIFTYPSKVVCLSQTTHNALMELCLICCEYGEKVAQNYSKRPFFKKIDTLCDRTKNDLMQSSGAVSNIKSQGIVWTIKELIFACTRIINAWNIIKGYVFDTSECLDKVRSAWGSEFEPSFEAWQRATKELLGHLRKSFLRLDTLAQTENNLKDVFTQLRIFKENLQKLKSAEVFFVRLFCRNYFPDFIDKTPDFKDIRSIVKKCERGGYTHIFEFVYDVRIIIYQVKTYLMDNNDLKLEKAIREFQKDVDNILAMKSFENYHF